MITIDLGGRTWELAPLSVRAASAWRARFALALEPAIHLLQARNREIGTVADLAGIVQEFGPALLTAPDVAADLVISWAPALETARDQILDTATDAEIMAALIELLRAAYPFGALMAWATPAPKPSTVNGLAERTPA